MPEKENSPASTLLAPSEGTAVGGGTLRTHQKPQWWARRSALTTSRAQNAPCSLITQDLRTTSQAPRLPWEHPGHYDICFLRAPIQVRGEGHTDDDDAAWLRPYVEVPRVPQNRGSRHVGIRRDLLPQVDASLSRIPTPSLHPGRRHSATHTRNCAHSNVTHDKPVAERRRWLTQGHVGSKLRSDKTARPQSLRSLPVSGWTETWAEWRERGEAEVPRGQDHGVKCPHAGQLKDFIHTMTRCSSTETPGFQDSSGRVPICNFVISLSFFLFLLKKEKEKKWARWGTEEDTSHSLGGWETAGIISPGWGSATTQTGG